MKTLCSAEQVSCNKSSFSLRFNSLIFQDSIGFDRSDPVDFDIMDLKIWHPRGDSLEFVVFDIILNCGVNLKINEIDHRFQSKSSQRSDCVRSHPKI